MSEKKSENPTPDSVGGEPLSGVGSREHLVKELRTRAESFYEQASLEQTMEARLIIRSLLAARGPLPEQGYDVVIQQVGRHERILAIV